MFHREVRFKLKLDKLHLLIYNEYFSVKCLYKVIIMSDLNLSNSIFQGYNDKHGLMICGYEWGWSKADEAAYVAGEYKLPENKIDHTFANKSLYLYYGEQA